MRGIKVPIMKMYLELEGTAFSLTFYENSMLQH